ncbi:MAG: exosortase N [Bacteroidota bacterium]
MEIYKLKHKIAFKYSIALVLILLATAVSIQNLAFYLNFDFNFILSLLVVPFVLFVKHKNVFSIRYGLLSLLFLGLYPILKIQSMFFFGYTFSLLFIIESTLGKLNNLPFFLLVLLSPLAIFIFEVFGFPIRLQLTEIAANSLSTFNNSISYSGNLICFNGNEFSVDPECMGLKMVVTSFLISLVVIAFFEKKTKKSISILSIIIILVVTGILIIISNLFRIIGIILFMAMPETTIHELIGIVSLIVYVLVPVYFVVKLFFIHFGRIVLPQKKNKKSIGTYPITIIVILILLFFNYNRNNYRNTNTNETTKEFHVTGYSCSLLKNGVNKLSNDSSLVYVKQNTNFYGADHTPLICWKGSGYKFKNEQVITISKQEVFLAELQSEEGKDKLFTSWWYDNGKDKTISQFEWRWAMLKGENAFNLMNVTSYNKEQLIKETEKMLNKDLFLR